MRVRLDVPYVDTAATQLRLHTGSTPRPALAVHAVELGIARVELRVLGGSHQVLVTDTAGNDLSEVVACDIADGTWLPRSREERFGRAGYSFRSKVVRLDREGFAATVEDLQVRLARRDDAVVAVFPGEEDAVTALALARDRPIGWTTWHTYPQTGEVVVTTTTLAWPC